MNINAISSFRPSLYVQNNQQKDSINTQNFNKQDIAFSSLMINPSSTKFGKLVVALVGLVALTTIGGNAIKNKNAQSQPNMRSGYINQIKRNDVVYKINPQFKPNMQSNYINRIKRGDITYKIDLDKSTAENIVGDMEIETKSGEKIHIPQIITKDLKVHYGLPKDNIAKGDADFVLDMYRTTLDSICGDFIVNTKSGEKLKFPFTILHSKPNLKLDSADIMKMVKK